MSGDPLGRKGNGFLSARLERALDLELRRRISLRDWIISAGIVIVLHLTGVAPISWVMFGVLLAVATVAVILWIWLFPRLSERGALAMEIIMSAVTASVLLALIAASGGASSPYIFFYALLVVFVAAFVESARAREALIALSGLFALAPIAYDWREATQGEFIPTIVIAVASWTTVGALIALKRSSAVRAEREARRLAYVDRLTGAGNRRALEEYAQLLEEVGQNFAIAVVRAVGVDPVNRAAGHLVGDELICRVANAMRAACGDDDQVVRLGGLEFAVILPGAEREDARRWSMRFQERLGLANATGQTDHLASAVTGVASEGTFAEMLSNAQEGATAVEVDLESEPRLLPDAAERAARLRRQVAASVHGPKRSAIESVRAPSSVPLALALAATFGMVLALTGGATSMWLGLAILLAGHFAIFGTRVESVAAAVSVSVATLGGVASAAPVSQVDQIRVLTVLATLMVIADSVQRNARLLEDAERRSAELSLIDPQTGLGNRSAFERDLVRSLPQEGGQNPSREERFEGLPAVVAISCADWKNGSQGSTDCDGLVVRDVAERLRDAVGEAGVVFRIGTRDFAVTLRAHHLQHVDQIAGRCAEALAAKHEGWAGSDDSPTFRIGTAIWSEGTSAGDLTAAAVNAQSPAGGPSRTGHMAARGL